MRVKHNLQSVYEYVDMPRMLWRCFLPRIPCTCPIIKLLRLNTAGIVHILPLPRAWLACLPNTALLLPGFPRDPRGCVMSDAGGLHRDDGHEAIPSGPILTTDHQELWLACCSHSGCQRWRQTHAILVHASMRLHRCFARGIVDALDNEKFFKQQCVVKLVNCSEYTPWRCLQSQPPHLFHNVFGTCLHLLLRALHNS